jgi:hypothetical protein
MVRFELVDDESLEYWKVILDDKSVIGIICDGRLRLSPRQDNSLTMKYDDLNIISKKVLEVERFGILTCQRCGGSPMFPKKVGSEGVGYTCREFIHPRL